MVLTVCGVTWPCDSFLICHNCSFRTSILSCHYFPFLIHLFSISWHTLQLPHDSSSGMIQYFDKYVWKFGSVRTVSVKTRATYGKAASFSLIISFHFNNSSIWSVGRGGKIVFSIVTWWIISFRCQSLYWEFYPSYDQMLVAIFYFQIDQNAFLGNFPINLLIFYFISKLVRTYLILRARVI